MSIIFSNKRVKNKILSHANLIILSFIAIVISVNLFQEVYSKIYEYKPRDMFNASRWREKLYRKAVKRVEKVKKIKDRFPKIPLLRPRRIIKEVDSTKHNPCNVIKDICLNGGICQSLGQDWYCNCPKTHYGKSCEFLADQTHCSNNFCENNSTCYSVKTSRTVPNPNVNAVKTCSKQMMEDSSFHLQCNYTLNLMYKCWCRAGYEGAFCDFTEGMRCCAEDLCNNHGIIYHDTTHKNNIKMPVDNDQFMNCTNVTCTCECEKYYNNTDNCLTVSPCRDYECFNAGECYENDEGLPKCNCGRTIGKFINDINVKITGDECEKIEINDDEIENCIPCSDKGFDEYFECLEGRLNKTKAIGIGKYFAEDCIDDDGNHRNCRELLKQLGKTCLKGQCRVSVANLSDIFWTDDGSPMAFTNPLILVPKCECPEGYEGDFCENRMLDECDRKDLEVHKAYLEETETTDSTMLQMANETFFRNIKTKLGQWNPAHSSNEGIMATQAFERALRSRGMRTFCGNHGYCRPYDEEVGMSCKCDFGFKGIECELIDPCSNKPCEKQKTNLCIDIPIMDGDSDTEEMGDALTYACICDTNESVDPATHECMIEHAGKYHICFDENKVPKCKNKGSCYPCALDQEVLKKADVKKTSLAICDDRETERGFRCLCPPGYQQPLCQNESTGCDYHKCQNGAKCEPLPDLLYQCICPPGYGPKTNGTTLTLCNQLEDICMIAECGNGTCAPDTKNERGFRCNCRSGYHGLNCEFVEPRDIISLIKKHYNWTYPLILFTLYLPVIIIINAVKDGACDGIIRAIRQRFSKNQPKYQKLDVNDVELENSEESIETDNAAPEPDPAEVLVEDKI